MVSSDPNQPSIEATYDYRDENGRLLFQVVRKAGKRFVQRAPLPGGGWTYSLKDVRRVPYRLPELVDTTEAEFVFLVEGEKDADNLANKLGVTTTTSPMGAGKWDPAFNDFFRRRPVVVLPDNDEPGRQHAEHVALQLGPAAESVRILELPGLAVKGDVSDWLEDPNHDLDELLRLVDTTRPWVQPVGLENGQLFDEKGYDPLRRKDKEDDGAVSPSSGTVEMWADPIPLVSLAEDLFPSFPESLFPEWLTDWIREEARATQTPRDLTGVLSLAVCAGAVARKFRVQVKPQWHEPLNLFCVVALPPGERKSTVFADILRPIKEVEKSLQEPGQVAINQAASCLRVLERQLTKAEKAAADTDDVLKRAYWYDQINLINKEISEVEVPDLPQLLCDNATSEVVARLLARQAGRLMVATPEGTPFYILRGRYGDASNYDVYLKGHAGDWFRVDRMSRESEGIDRPALTVAMAVQPDVIAGLGEQPEMKGRGLLGRFLYSLPRSLVGSRQIDPAPVDADVQQRYETNMRALWEIEADRGNSRTPDERILTLSEEAHEVRVAFSKWLEPALGPKGSLASTDGWGDKLVGAAVRIAGVLQMADWIDADPSAIPTAIPTAIEGKWMERARQFAVDYLIPHALAAHGLIGSDPTVAKANKILEHLREIVAEQRTLEGAESFRVTRREIHSCLRRLFPKVKDIVPALDLLVEYGWLKEIVPPGDARRGRPSVEFFVHPEIDHPIHTLW